MAVQTSKEIGRELRQHLGAMAKAVVLSNDYFSAKMRECGAELPDRTEAFLDKLDRGLCRLLRIKSLEDEREEFMNNRRDIARKMHATINPYVPSASGATEHYITSKGSATVGHSQLMRNAVNITLRLTGENGGTALSVDADAEGNFVLIEKDTAGDWTERSFRNNPQEFQSVIAEIISEIASGKALKAAAAA